MHARRKVQGWYDYQVGNRFYQPAPVQERKGCIVYNVYDAQSWLEAWGKRAAYRVVIKPKRSKPKPKPEQQRLI